MDFRIAVPADRSDEFKTSLFRFLGQQADENDAFAMHWSEPRGAETVQYVHFASDEAARAFQSRWAIESAELDAGLS